MDKAFDRKRARGGLRGSRGGNALSRVRCYNCQAFGHFARDCKANTGSEAVGRSHKRRRTYDELNKEWILSINYKCIKTVIYYVL